jgi:hypothetical protein
VAQFAGAGLRRPKGHALIVAHVVGRTDALDPIRAATVGDAHAPRPDAFVSSVPNVQPLSSFNQIGFLAMGSLSRWDRLSSLLDRTLRAMGGLSGVPSGIPAMCANGYEWVQPQYAAKARNFNGIYDLCTQHKTGAKGAIAPRRRFLAGGRSVTGHGAGVGGSPRAPWDPGCEPVGLMGFDLVYIFIYINNLYGFS